MTGRGGRGAGFVLAVVAVAALGVGVVVLVPGAKRGDVDPVGMLVGGAGLLAGLAAVWLTWLTLGHGDTDPSATAVRLAGQVLAAESQARSMLLGGGTAAIDVRFVFRPTPAHNAEGARPEGTLRGVADYYRRLRPGRLVVTGAPGSGKTVLAIDLVLALLKDRDPGDPVPVRLSLASWAELDTGAPEDPDQPSTPAPDPKQVVAWLVRVLVETYRLRRAAARSLVDAGMVLPVLDGLDEMDAADTGTSLYRTRARRALDTLNAYQHGRDPAPVVLTSRSAAYLGFEPLRVWARDATRVEITPVSLLQAREFIKGRASDPERWRPVLDHLNAAPSGALARGLSTPWRLTAALTAHEQRDRDGTYLTTPRDLLDPALATEDAVRDHLIRLLLTTTVQAHPPPGHADPARVRTWLGTLAAYLNTNAATGRAVAGRTLSGTDLVPHELWPIAGPRRARATHLLMVFAAACLTASACALTAVTTGNSDIAVGVLPGTVLTLLGLQRSRREWPEPSRVNWSRLRIPAVRRSFADVLGFWLLIGVGYGIEGDPAFGLAGGIVFGLALGIASALGATFDAGLDDGGSTAVAPGDVVRGDFTAGLTHGLAFGLANGIAFGPALGLATVLMCALVSAIVAKRYLALLICTRRGPVVLPWSLLGVLAWAEQAGLLRTAGNAYQFRHRELQDWLADPANHP